MASLTEALAETRRNLGFAPLERAKEWPRSSDGTRVRQTPAEPTPAREQGFILIEVLVSALVITVVAGAVLALVTATTRSAADQRTHADAYGVAQEDQSRLRSMRISSLNRLQQTRTVSLNGTRFTVESTGVFVNNSTGESSSCTSEGSSADYVKITSSVTWQNSRKPVTLQSIVAPSNNSLNPSHGTLAIQATNGAGQPLSGVGISGTGIGNFSGSTDATGCANFADLQEGNYTLTTTATGLVDADGNLSPWSKTVGVVASSTQLISVRYDRPGTVPVTFKYRVGSSEKFETAYADAVVAYNAEMPSGAHSYGTAGGSRLSQINATPLFPFKAADTVYAGACEANNPNPKGEANPPGAPAMASVVVPAGLTASPVVLQLPALNLTLTYNGTPVSGARVTITDRNCKVGGVNVKRVYTTNASGAQSAATNGVAEPGLPWGSYEVCASAEVKAGESRRIKASPVAVENLTAGTTLALSLSGGSSEANRTCP
jgi:Tfp pilus assembly protein PilV